MPPMMLPGSTQQRRPHRCLVAGWLAAVLVWLPGPLYAAVVPDPCPSRTTSAATAHLGCSCCPLQRVGLVRCSIAPEPCSAPLRRVRPFPEQVPLAAAPAFARGSFLCTSPGDRAFQTTGRAGPSGLALIVPLRI